MMRKAVLHNYKALNTLQHLREISVLQFKVDAIFSFLVKLNRMKNQISALNDPFPSLDDLLGNWFGVGGSWLKYLLLIPLMLLTILFVFCLFHKIIVSCVTKCMTEPPRKIMMPTLEAVDQMYSSIFDQ